MSRLQIITLLLIVLSALQFKSGYTLTEQYKFGLAFITTIDPTVLPRLQESMSASNCGDGGDNIYVAVSKDMNKNKPLLTWVSENLGGKQLCCVHVHVHVHGSSTETPENLDDDEHSVDNGDYGWDVLYQPPDMNYRFKKEDRHLSEAIDYHLSRRRVPKVYVAALSVVQGLLMIVEQNSIQNLVMGTKVYKGRLFENSDNRLSGVQSRKAIDMNFKSPPYCHISFICEGRRVANRPSIDPVPQRPHINVPGEIDSAEKSRPADSEDSLRQQIAENMALGDAVAQAKTADILYKKELRLREAKEEELKKSLDELSMTVARKCSLEDQLDELNISLKESEKRLRSSEDLLEEYQNMHEDMQLKMNNALEEADNLRKQLAEGPSNSNLPRFFSVFSRLDLENATNNFDLHLKIGEGGYGDIYKGFLHHTEVAIKKLHQNSSQGPREFLKEVEILSKLRHRNLVTLVGACPESWALVYEYLPGGNLEDRLTCKDGSSPLPWQIRIRIALELCSAIIFLHSSQLDCIIHGDLKPSNVLLDENCVCKLGDFGISRVASRSTDQTTMIFTDELKGTFVYMAPELFSSGELTRKSDVYSFGIILLQLLTGKTAFGIAKDVASALSKGTLDRLLDPSAGDWPFFQAEKVARMAVRCCDICRENRPDLASDVWEVLAPLRSSSQGLSLLRLVSDNQVPNYFICPIDQEIMMDPHIASDGFTYEAEAIRDWLGSGHNTSPMTNDALANRSLTPNRALRSAIQEWLQINRTA